ncbi:MAG: MFS transporter [Candidatus Rokubacteria bacterium]|nr:MFS transporter [Candidatus Rokubacteria bacterium]
MASSYLVVWALFVFAWAANFMIRIGFSALLPPIIRDLELSYTQAGALASAFFWAYLALQIPSGLLGDRFGRRRVLVLGLVGVAAATALTGLAGSFGALIVARLATGAGQGSLFSNDRAIIAAVTPREKIGLGQGVSFTGPGLGITLGLMLGGILADALSWRTVLALFALGPLAAALAIGRWVPWTPASSDAAALWPRLRAVLATGPVWVLGAAGASGIYVQFVLATWAPMFFIETGVDGLAQAGTLASIQGLAAVAGLVTGGWADDRLRRRGGRHRTLIAASLTALALSMGAMALALARGSAPGVGVTLALAAFFVWAIWGAAYALLGELIAVADLGAAFGLFNSICFVGAIVGPAVTGWVRDLTGSFAAGCEVAVLVALAGAAIATAIPSPAPTRDAVS